MINEFGRIMLDIEGTSLTDEDKFVITNEHVGGIIFFSRNFESYEQIKNLIIEIKNIKENIIFAVDHEGGRVQRFKNEFTKIPSMQEISLYAKKNSNSKIFKEVAWLSSSRVCWRARIWDTLQSTRGRPCNLPSSRQGDCRRAWRTPGTC